MKEMRRNTTNSIKKSRNEILEKQMEIRNEVLTKHNAINNRLIQLEKPSGKNEFSSSLFPSFIQTELQPPFLNCNYELSDTFLVSTTDTFGKFLKTMTNTSTAVLLTPGNLKHSGISNGYMMISFKHPTEII